MTSLGATEHTQLHINGLTHTYNWAKQHASFISVISVPAVFLSNDPWLTIGSQVYGWKITLKESHVCAHFECDLWFVCFGNLLLVSHEENMDCLDALGQRQQLDLQTALRWFNHLPNEPSQEEEMKPNFAVHCTQIQVRFHFVTDRSFQWCCYICFLVTHRLVFVAHSWRFEWKGQVLSGRLGRKGREVHVVKVHGKERMEEIAC